MRNRRQAITRSFTATANRIFSGNRLTMHLSPLLACAGLASRHDDAEPEDAAPADTAAEPGQSNVDSRQLGLAALRVLVLLVAGTSA